ncbi:MAG: hypothetical protein R3B90_16250 [Planctomycetaceae bacterium]
MRDAAERQGETRPGDGRALRETNEGPIGSPWTNFLPTLAMLATLRLYSRKSSRVGVVPHGWVTTGWNFA